MIRKLMKSIREFKRDSILTPLFVSFEVIIEVAIPFYMAKIVDNGINAGDIDYVMRTGSFLVVLAFISLYCGAMSGRYAAKASAGFSKNLRSDMFAAIQTFSFKNIGKFSTSSLVTRMTTDVVNVQLAYQMIIRVLIRSPLMVIFSLFMTMSINARLALIFVAVVPLLGIGLIVITLQAHPYFEKVFAQYDELNNIVQENVQSMRVVKSFVREDYEITKFAKISKHIYELYRKAEKRVILNSPLMQFCMYTTILFFSWFGAQFIIAGSMKTGELMSMIVYASQILSSLMMMSMVFVMIMISRASAERIVEVLDEKSDLVNPEHPVFEVMDGSIVFDHVNFNYGDKHRDNWALSDINLSIRSGETIGILGGTGSSKTSLVQLIPRLYDVSEGCLLVGGHDVREYDLDTLRNQVAMVLQQNTLFSGTVAENLRWGNEHASQQQLEHACRIAQADEFIQRLPMGYETVLEQGASNLSGGQKQRLCIARALLKEPKILIFDDSTSAVDTRTDSLIIDGLTSDIPDTTKIIIAQRVSSIEKADRVIILDQGEVNAFDTPDNLLATNAIYQEVYNSQTKGAAIYETKK